MAEFMPECQLSKFLTLNGEVAGFAPESLAGFAPKRWLVLVRNCQPYVVCSFSWNKQQAKSNTKKMSPDWVDMLRNSRLSRSDSAYFVSDSGWICSEFRSDFNRPTPTGWVCSEIRSQGTHIYPEYLILSLFLGAYLPECPKLVLAGFSRNVGGYGPNYAVRCWESI